MINTIIIFLLIISLLLIFFNNNTLFKRSIMFCFIFLVVFLNLFYMAQSYTQGETSGGNVFALFADFTNIKFNFLIFFSALFIIGFVFLSSVKNTNITEIGIIFTYFATSLGIIYNKNLFFVLLYWEILAVLGALIIAFSNSVVKKSVAINYFIVHALSGVLFLIGTINYSNLYFTFSITNINLSNFASYCLLFALLINLALPPLSAWLVNGYSQSSSYSAIFLAIYTTKSAVFVLYSLFANTPILAIFGAIITTYAFILAFFEANLRKRLAYNVMHSLGLTVFILGFTSNAIALSYLLIATLFKLPMFFVLHNLQHKHNATSLDTIYKKINIFSLNGIIITLFALENLSFIGLGGYVAKYWLHIQLHHVAHYIEYIFVALGAMSGSILAFPLMHKAINYTKQINKNITYNYGFIMQLVAYVLVFALLLAYGIGGLFAVNVKQASIYMLENIITAVALYTVFYAITKNYSNALPNILYLLVSAVKLSVLQVLNTTTKVNIYKPSLIAKSKISNANYKALSINNYSGKQTLLAMVVLAVVYVVIILL